jgi:hypothetical protein
VAVVTPEFFDLAGARAATGRLLTWQDVDASVPVAVVNHSFARKFPQESEIVGRRLRTGDREYTVVGIVEDLLIQDVEDRDGAGVYLSMLQERPHVIRTMTGPRAEPHDAFHVFRTAVQDVDPDLPVLEPASLYDAIFADKRVLDAMSALFLAFGVGTVFLAVIGLFAVLSFTVTARTREFGVRMALGATPGSLVALVLSRAAREILLGLGIGLPVAFAISRVLAATLERVPVAGAGVYAAIVMTIVTGALLAIWSPVRRVLRLSPLEALREE